MQSLRMVLPLASAGSVSPGWDTFLASTWTNVWANSYDFSLDYEMLETRVAMSYGFNEKIGISLALDNRTYFGGEMDHFIQNVHHVIGVDPNGRDLEAKGRSQVSLPGSSGTISKADIFANKGVTMSLRYDLTDGDEAFPAVSLAASVRYGIETGAIFREEHPLDYGFSVGLAKRWSAKTYSHAILSYSLYDFDQSRDGSGFISIILEDQLFSGFTSFGYEYSDRLTILLQYLFTEAAVQNISKLNEASHEVHFGFKYRTDSAGMIEFGLIENMINADNSPDFGAHLGWSCNF
jgi:hypothetical protein